MTEAEWGACQNVHEMLQWLHARGEPNERRLRLFVVNCLRKVLHLFEGRACQAALEIIEQHVEGQATNEQLSRVAADLDQAYPDVLRTAGVLQAEVFEGVCNAASAEIWSGPNAVDNAADAATMEAARHLPESEGLQDPSWEAAIQVIRASIRKEQCDCLRDLYGPLPFREVRIDPTWLAWNGGTVWMLAQDVYGDRRLSEGTLDNGRLAILADALEEAGCNNEEILTHLRGRGPHLRGCWAVDLLLDKR
jgi:hypothetical protein